MSALRALLEAPPTAAAAATLLPLDKLKAELQRLDEKQAALQKDTSLKRMHSIYNEVPAHHTVLLVLVFFANPCPSLFLLFSLALF